MFLAKICILPKPSILDPQGLAVSQSLKNLGHTEVEDLRVGRYIEVSLNVESRSQAEKKIERCCEVLLANTVIESYHFELEPISS